jgi:hypothetical protein
MTDQIPQVSELHSALLEAALLKTEVAALRGALCEKEGELARIRLNAIASALEQPGYVLQRAPDGAWVYQPNPPAHPAPGDGR